MTLAFRMVCLSPAVLDALRVPMAGGSMQPMCLVACLQDLILSP